MAPTTSLFVKAVELVAIVKANMVSFSQLKKKWLYCYFKANFQILHEHKKFETSFPHQPAMPKNSV